MGYGFNDRNFYNMEKVFSEEHKFGKIDKQQLNFLGKKDKNA